MPRASVIARAPKFPTLANLVALKRVWTTSVAALNYRLHEVGMLTDWQYRTLCIHIAKSGFRIQEPNEAPREDSQLLSAMFAALYREGISRAHIARTLGIAQAELEQLMFGLTMTSIQGNKKSNRSGASVHSRLSLVPKDDTT
jgi:hypothetical protein